MAKWWKPIALLFITLVLAVSLKNDFVYFLLGFELMVYLAAYALSEQLLRCFIGQMTS